uniref:Uncharacterized protein n=1 Tax=Ditylenchus dipsaci TaxID=166011 RepID=A0A915EGS5_9BILA
MSSVQQANQDGKRSTKGLFVHAKTHEEYAAKLKELEEKNASQKNAIEKFEVTKVSSSNRKRWRCIYSSGTKWI